MLNGLLGKIVSILIAAAISGGASAMSEVEPWDAADAFFQDLSAGDKQTTMKVRNCDFRKTMDNYKKESYEYVTENLYSDDVINKEKLNKKCLDIYLDQVEKTAGEEPSYEAEVFLPMEQDGYGGWRMILSDEIMKEILGELEIPTNE